MDPNNSSIVCSCTIEWLSKSGAVNKTVKGQNVNMRLVRNEFRDLFLVIESKVINQKLLMKGSIVHKKFMHEGKATINFPNAALNVFIRNAAPTQLVAFLKTLFIKLCSSKSSPKTALKDQLLSTKAHVLQEISPVNSKDVNRVKSSIDDTITLKRTNNNIESQKSSKRVCLNPTSTLTEEQKQILDAVLRGSNVFFTGGAGTGKSYLLQYILNSLQPDVTVATASTGSAACLIGGVTLHSFAGIGLGEGTLERCLSLASRPIVKQCWRKCKHLIIDEISMITSSYFEKLEWVARNIRGNDRPFGGIQLIVCGDFLQLPPVKKEKGNHFCFVSEAWEKICFQTYYLKQVHRQNDPLFVSILNNVRLGRLTPDMVEELQKTETQRIEKDGILASRLCCYSREAKEINDTKLAKLDGDSKVYEAIDSSPMVSNFLDECTPVEKSIILKIGAQVMLLKNINVSLGFVNGARGIVEKFTNGLPVVKFLCGKTFSVKQEKWTVRAANGAIHERKQIPLRLAWAFSIHKSQGLTLDCVEMSLDNTFEAGQAYVALSRAKNLNSIRVIAFQSGQVWANPDALKFYKNLVSYQQEYIPLGKKKKSQKKLFPELKI